MNRLRVATFTVHATAAQSARWKQAAEAEGFASAGAWLAAAADSYLRARTRAGQPVPLAWRRGVFKATVVEGEERTVRGFVSPPYFGAFRGDGTGRQRRHAHLYRLVYLPTGRVLVTLSRYRQCREFAADIARVWARAGLDAAMEAPATLESPARGIVLP